MAENPATWGRLEQAIARGQRVAEMGRRAGKIGFSEVRIIADSVRATQACDFCNEHPNDGPAHFASRGCQSGGHNHCACDVCF